MLPIRILFADDDHVMLRALANILKERLPDAAVDYVASGGDGLHKVAERMYDAIVTDLNMPDIDGCQLMKLTKVLQPEVAVIVISGAVDAQVRYEVLAQGAYDVFAKPFDAAYFVSTIRHAVQYSRLMRRVAALQQALAEHTREAYLGADASALNLPGWPQQLALPWRIPGTAQSAT